MERVKNLVLIGKIPIQNAPPEMANHPIMIIERYCDHLIAERRAKVCVYFILPYLKKKSSYKKNK